MDGLRIRRVNRANWRKWSRVVLRTMRATLPKETCLSARDMRSIFNEDRYAAFLVTRDERFVGFAIGFFCTFDDEPEIDAIGDANIFHLCLNVVDPAFQGNGVGLTLLNARIAEAKRRGARTCTCYARSGASLYNLMKVGGKVIGVRKNFFGSGETFFIVRVDIA